MSTVKLHFLACTNLLTVVTHGSQAPLLEQPSTSSSDLQGYSFLLESRSFMGFTGAECKGPHPVAWDLSFSLVLLMGGASL